MVITLKHFRTIVPLLLLTILICVSYVPNIYYCYSEINVNESIIKEFKVMVKDLTYLSELGIDTFGLSKELDRALDLIQKGRYSEANTVLLKVKKELESLKSRASHIHLINEVRKYTIVVLIGLAPVLTYFLLPRLYLYLWYRYRRKWLVEGVKK